MIMQDGAHKLEVRREALDVTSLNRPDTAWTETDAAGHVHRWLYRDDGGQLVYDREYRPDRHYKLPSLSWVVEAPATDDYPEVGHYVCSLCGAEIIPRLTADDTTQYIAGPTNYFVDDERVDRETFMRYAEEPKEP